MATTISEIKNLTNGKVINDVNKLTKFDNQAAFSATIKATDITLADWSDFKPADNIQVTWNDGTKVVARAVGGVFNLTGTDVTISGLADVSKYSVGINGQLAIGPKTKPDTVLVSVRVGNLNPRRDMIIDFSDKQDGAPGTSIKLNDLVEWIKGSTGDDTAAVDYPEIKDKDGKPKVASDFMIEFKEFHFNITQKTFDFNVASQDGSEITFGNFTIKKVGFRITNEPVNEPVTVTKALPEKVG